MQVQRIQLRFGTPWQISGDLDTIFGEFSFNDVGDAVYDPIVLIVENGELKTFE